MKLYKYLAIALVATMFTSCGDDEPSSSFTRDFNMVFPQLEAGHKSISKIERNYTNGASSTVNVDYDGDKLKSIKVVNRDKNGSKTNEETIYFDYKNGAIVCDRSIQDKTYAFEVNALGAITKLTDVSTSQVVGAFNYNALNQVESATSKSSTASASTTYKWTSAGNVSQWVERKDGNVDSVAYVYSSAAIANRGGLDITGNQAFTLTSLVCSVMRNAGLFGATNALLPSAIKKDIDYDKSESTGKQELKNYDITYTLDAEGYVKSYTTTESPRYTVTFTYR